MALDINKLIADAQAARADAIAAKAEADKAAAAVKTSNAANKKFKIEAQNKLMYANTIKKSIADIEDRLTVYATTLGKGEKLGPGEQKDFDNLVKQYKKVDAQYSKTIDEANKILAKAPSPTKVDISNNQAVVGPTKEEVAATGLTATSTSTTGTGPTVETINANLDQQIKNSRALLLGMSGAQRKQLATTLTNAGFAVTPTEQFQDALLLQYQAALNLAKSENVNNKGLVDPIDLTGFLSNKTILQNQLKAGQPGGGTGAGTRLTTNISSPTEAAGFIQPLFKSILGRDATPAEVTSITNKLIAAEKDPKNKVKTVTDSKGNVTYSGGIDHSQFITDIVKGLPEFAKKKETATGLTAQSLTATANANGVKLSPEQVSIWSTEIQNGGDINAINNRIRAIAGMGQPENVKKLLADGTDLEVIYSPYKQLMASTLEINPATIGLNDPTLRMAIGPDREMTTYDYQNALRKDNRWQYTNQAHTEVADATQRILRDFGFQG